MNPETKNCQSCKQDFIIESEDFAFYDKIEVPAPTFCPECRLVRRLIWRNERALYKRVCQLCDKSIISTYAPESPYIIYCPECWRSDNWDPMEYGQDYDFSKPFFAQFRELQLRVPRIALNQSNATNSPFANYLESVSDVYLSYSAIFECQYLYYCRNVDHSKNCFDCYDISSNERCYENVGCEKNYNTAYAYFSRSAIDSYFIYDCVNVSHCFLCTNLRNQEYSYKNQKYSKEDYEEIVSSYRLDTHEGMLKAEKEFKEMYRSAIHRFAHTLNTIESTGDDIRNCKNIKNAFGSSGCEDGKNIMRCPSVKDVMDVTNLGKTERAYEYMGGGATGSQELFFCMNLMPGDQSVFYSDYCGSVASVFGSIGVRSKQYVIFNKQYSKEEYEALVPKIIEHMKTVPFTDSSGKVYRYGEFFPEEFSTFSYNETNAQEYFPLIKSEALARGYKWRDPEARSYTITIDSASIPSDINQVTDSITTEVLGCQSNGDENTLCTTAFKVLPEEVQFYKSLGISLPRLCPNCRYFKRSQFKNPLKLWHRSCMCDLPNHSHEGKCSNKFETSYNSDRPEKVFCEKCYQAEVL